MDTTTSDGGVAPATQPEETSEAVDNEDVQVITQDENGTPTTSPVQPEDSEESTESAEAVSEGETQEETQASDRTDEEIVAWAEKKGIKVDPENPNELKLARNNLEAERKMHEANQVKSPVQPPEELELTGTDTNYDEVAERLNKQEQLIYVRNWFDANPDAKDHRTELQQIAQARPWLSDMDDVYAHFLANPKREQEIKRAGGKEALTNLAQKQQQIPPASGATNSQVFESQQITSKNVYELVDKNDQEWFEKNHDAISKAMQG